ncbi:MAG TPA: GAF domain-containing protein, partial [Spirochaetia bacterium]|nr:GAF domain-containing protein [Spirochaetia bacterium]
MPFLLIVDLTSFGLSLMVSTSLALIVAGGDLRSPLNRSFLLFALLETAWAVLSLLLRLALWLGQGAPEHLLWGGTLSFALMGPLLLLFAARQARLRSRWATYVAIAAVALIAAAAYPLFQGHLISGPTLSAAGLIRYELAPLGYLGALIPGSCFVLSVVVFVTSRREGSQRFMAVSAVLLLLGLAVGALERLGLPLMSVATLTSVSVLGWVIVRRQLFNPLRELTGDLRERAHRQELVAKVSQSTTATLEMNELLLQAARLVQSSFQYFRVGIFLIEGDQLVLMASTYPAAQAYSGKFRLTVGKEGICGWVAASGQSLLVGDVSKEPRYVKLVESVTARSELAVPIRRGKKVIGVLDVQSALPNAFTASDLFTLQTIADQLSSAIENARLYEETRRRAERLSLVNRISSAAGSVLDLADLLETVYREMTHIFGADAFYLALYDPVTNSLDYRLQVDEGLRIPQEREPVGVGLTSRVIVERRPLLVNDPASSTEHPPPETWGTGKVPISWIGVPMLSRDRLVGVISVQTYREHHYDAEDLQLAATIADQVAVAVENARLYEEARQELAVRQRAEKVLRESEEKFRNLAEQSPNMIFIWSSGKVVYANRQCSVMMGYTRAEFYDPAFDFMVLTASGFESIVMDNLARHRRGEEVPPYEYGLVTRQGRRIDAILTSKLIRYAGAPAILGTITDITTRKHAELLLHSLNSAALAMERALHPAEIFPLALRELASQGLQCAVRPGAGAAGPGGRSGPGTGPDRAPGRGLAAGSAPPERAGAACRPLAPIGPLDHRQRPRHPGAAGRERRGVRPPGGGRGARLRGPADPDRLRSPGGGCLAQDPAHAGSGAEPPAAPPDPGAVPPCPEDGGNRPVRRRHRARVQQSPHGDFRALQPPGGCPDGQRIRAGAARPDPCGHQAGVHPYRSPLDLQSKADEPSGGAGSEQGGIQRGRSARAGHRRGHRAHRPAHGEPGLPARGRRADGADHHQPGRKR